MRPQLRSELIKLTSTRTVYGLILGAMVVLALGTWSTISSAGADNVTGPLHTQPFFFLGAVNLGAFALILGIRAMTDEFHYGTVVFSAVTTRSRARLVTAKATVAAAAAATLAVLAQATMASLALALTGRSLIPPSTHLNSSLQVTVTDWAAMAGLGVASALWAAIGVGVGALVRQQVAAIVGAIIWVLVVENLGAELLGTTGRYLPGQAAQGLAQLPDLLTVPAAATLLTGYAAAFLLLGHRSLVRRDI